jgi:uncharacterized membrane protein
VQTGENEHSLRKIIDMSRLISVGILILHFYYFCYTVFQQWDLTATLTDRLLANIQNTGLFDNFHKSKLFALGFLFISLIGSRGRKQEQLSYKNAFYYIITGLAIYFLSYLLLKQTTTAAKAAITYISITSIGFMLVLSGGTLLSRVIHQNLSSKDIFNNENEGRQAPAAN